MLESVLRKKAGQQSDIFIGMMKEWLTTWETEFVKVAAAGDVAQVQIMFIKTLVEGQIAALGDMTPEAMAGLFAKHKVLAQAKDAMSIFGDLKDEEL